MGKVKDINRRYERDETRGKPIQITKKKKGFWGKIWKKITKTKREYLNLNSPYCYNGDFKRFWNRYMDYFMFGCYVEGKLEAIPEKMKEILELELLELVKQKESTKKKLLSCTRPNAY